MGLESDINHLFCFEERQFEMFSETPCFAAMFERSQFIGKVAPFESDDAIRQCVSLFVVDVLPDETHKFW